MAEERRHQRFVDKQLLCRYILRTVSIAIILVNALTVIGVLLYAPPHRGRQRPVPYCDPGGDRGGSAPDCIIFQRPGAPSPSGAPDPTGRNLDLNGAVSVTEYP